MQKLFDAIKARWDQLWSSHRAPSDPLPASSRAAIDLHDPLGGVARDAELLLAFAAQSRRSLARDKIEALTKAVEAVAAARRDKRDVTAQQKADLWHAYDALALDMAPLSAQSIRASMQVNDKRFPGALLTPTALNAMLALAVFFVCLVLQTFWVAGKELLDKADAIEAQRIEIQQKMSRVNGALKRSEAKERGIDRQICLLKPPKYGCSSEELFGRQELVLPGPASVDGAPNAALPAHLTAQRDAVHAETVEKEIEREEIDHDLGVLNERSRPLEDLLREWHRRARSVCDRPGLSYLCPVDKPGDPSSDDTLAARIANHKGDLKLAKAESERLKVQAAAESNTDRNTTLQRLTKQREIAKLQHELARMESDRFRSIVHEVRLIVANLGSYLVPLAMGLLVP